MTERINKVTRNIMGGIITLMFETDKGMYSVEYQFGGCPGLQLKLVEGCEFEVMAQGFVVTPIPKEFMKKLSLAKLKKVNKPVVVTFGQVLSLQFMGNDEVDNKVYKSAYMWDDFKW